jgi:hypothetical protein
MSEYIPDFSGFTSQQIFPIETSPTTMTLILGPRNCLEIYLLSY